MFKQSPPFFYIKATLRDESSKIILRSPGCGSELETHIIDDVALNWESVLKRDINLVHVT